MNNKTEASEEKVYAYNKLVLQSLFPSLFKDFWKGEEKKNEWSNDYFIEHQEVK